MKLMFCLSVRSAKAVSLTSAIFSLVCASARSASFFLFSQIRQKRKAKMMANSRQLATSSEPMPRR